VAHAYTTIQEAEIRRITVQSQPGEIVWELLSQKHPSQKKAGGVAQGIGPEFKPQYCKNKQTSNQRKPKGLGCGWSVGCLPSM
jgi:hypothetical protein